MKKSFFLSILAVGALVACSKSEVVETSFDNAIKFENYVGRDAQTKATEVAGVTSVNVNAWLHDKGGEGFDGTGFQANFMTNQAVTKNDDNTWTYSPAKYWPNDLQAVSFVGWVPVANMTVTDANIDFTVPTDVKQQTDLLVSNPVLNQNGGAVALTFKHLLSRIGFEINVSGVVDTDTNNKIELVEVTLNGNFASAGTVNMTAKTPTVVGEVAKTAYKLTGDNFKNVTSNLLTNGNHANADDSYIMLIPNGNVPDNITVVYTITTEGEDGAADVVITNTKEFKLQTAGAETPFAYAPGMAYKYVFNITMAGISFTVSETPWDEETYPAVPMN